MFGETIIQQDEITIRLRRDGSIEISHMNEHGTRCSKVYYGYGLAEAVHNYKENEL